MGLKVAIETPVGEIVINAQTLLPIGCALKDAIS